MHFLHWLRRRTQHEHKQDPPPTIVADELLRHLQACGPSGVAKRDLLAGMRRERTEAFDELIRVWQELGQIETWTSPSGETMLRLSGHG